MADYILATRRLFHHEDPSPTLSEKEKLFENRYISKAPDRNVSAIDDDGYIQSYNLARIAKFFRGMVSKLTNRKPGKLILVRHGETNLNMNRTFTGWIDTDLSERGIKEIEHAANLLQERGYKVDITYTSRLKRAIRTAWILNFAMNQVYKPVYKSWRLNERMYGDLESKSKPGIMQLYGADVVNAFKVGYKGRPPPMQLEHPYWHANERKYSDLDPSEIPLTESLEDCMKRAMVLYEEKMKTDIRMGKNVLVAAHANSLRGLIKHLEQLDENDISDVSIPNGIPLVYEFDSSMKIITRPNALPPLRGEYLEEKGLFREVLKREKELTAARSRYDPEYTILSILQNSSHSNSSIDQESFEQFDAQLLPQYQQQQQQQQNKLILAAVEYGIGTGLGSDLPLPEKKVDEAKRKKQPQYLVLLRHGKTEHNRLGLFTGWEDVPLIDVGRAEARKAGQILRLHGIEFDVVYTSWLSRSIETAWLVLNEMDSMWLPIVKTWRLNERMYGALTGLSKSMVQERHGLERFNRWRLSYETRPPPVSPFSINYPGNDARYVENIKDIRYSFFESFIRSVSHGRLELHRKFPRTESLKDCMSRTIPFYTNTIVPKAIDKGKNVLITSSENAIRGLLMHLMDIPPDRIQDVQIPTGLPLVFNLEKRCIQLLDDGVERDSPTALWEQYNFGTAPELLFKPCTADPNELAKNKSKNKKRKSNKKKSNSGKISDMKIGSEVEYDEEDEEDSCFAYSVDGRTFRHDPIIRLEQSPLFDPSPSHVNHLHPHPVDDAATIYAKIQRFRSRNMAVNESISV